MICLTKRSDVVIVGAGPAGSTAALYARYFGLDYLLIDQHDFPRDKVCGDALAPVIFSLIHEVGLTLPTERFFCKPSGFQFVFSDKDNSVSHFIEHRADSLMFNCKRIHFDFQLFSLLGDSERFLRPKVTHVDHEGKKLTVQGDEETQQIEFRWLILATGSGKNLLDPILPAGKTICASRAYVRSDTTRIDNVVDFFQQISPGYFWSFPVGEGIFNTGILFHTPPSQTDVHNIHMSRLREYLPDFELLHHTRWPLRVHSPERTLMLSDVVAIGDANHSIDPVFGHGIDTGMLEAREQVRSVKQIGAFASRTPILNLIHQKNEISERCRIALMEDIDPEKKLKTLMEYLRNVNDYYPDVKSSLADGSI